MKNYYILEVTTKEGAQIVPNFQGTSIKNLKEIFTTCFDESYFGDISFMLTPKRGYLLTYRNSGNKRWITNKKSCYSKSDVEEMLNEPPNPRDDWDDDTLISDLVERAWDN